MSLLFSRSLHAYNSYRYLNVSSIIINRNFSKTITKTYERNQIANKSFVISVRKFSTVNNTNSDVTHSSTPNLHSEAEQKMNPTSNPELNKNISDTSYYEMFTTEIKQVKNEILFMTKYLEDKKYSKFKLKCMFWGFTILILFLSWRTIKSFITQETSDVAIKTMNDDDFKRNIHDLMNDLLIFCKNDPDAQKKIVDLLSVSLQHALNDKETMNILNKIVCDVILSEQVENDFKKLTKCVVQEQLNDKDNKDLLTKTLSQSVNETYANTIDKIINRIFFWRKKS
jgi:hypothetical protein